MPYKTDGSRPLALVDASVITGNLEERRAGTTVLIRGGRIADLLPASDGVPDGYEKIDCTGKFVIPGLIENHVHWESWMGELFLVHGVTSVLDTSTLFPMHWMNAQREGLSDGRIFGPRLRIAGPLIHGARTKAEGLQNYPTWFPSVETPEEARAAAWSVVEQGVDLLKAYTLLDLDAIEAIATVASEAGLPSLGHISENAAEAAKRGITGLAHGSGLIQAVVPPDKLAEIDPLALKRLSTLGPEWPTWFTFADDDLIDATIDTFIECGTYLEPDLIHTGLRGGGARFAEYEVEDIELLQDQRLAYVPAHFKAEVLGFRRLNRWTAVSAEQYDAATAGMDRMVGIFAEFARRGGRLVVASGLAHVAPGISMHREMQIMVDAGVTPLTALRGATAIAAAFQGILDDVGTVEIGKRADLVVLDRDPLADIANTRAISHVIQHGRQVVLDYHPWHENPIPNPPHEFVFARIRPRIDGIVPPAVPYGLSTRLTLTGAGFAPHSVARVGGIGVPTEVVDYETANITVDGGAISRPGLFDVTIERPEPMELENISEAHHLVVSFGDGDGGPHAE